MEKQAIFVLGFIFIVSGFASAQEAKVVTNADLEKFKEKRLAAEKDLQENYAEMGFPSPEEIKKQNEESRRELNELADELREERLAREAQEKEAQQGNLNDYYVDDYSTGYPLTREGFIDYGGYYSSGYYFYNGRYHKRYRQNRGNRRFNRNRDFRDRFIRGLPDYILRTHRFNTFDTNRRVFPKRRGFRKPPRKRN